MSAHSVSISRITQLTITTLLLAGYCASSHLLMAQDNAARKSDEQSPETLFAELDKNGDDKLTADEVPQERLRFFQRLLRVAGKEKNGEFTKPEFFDALKPEVLNEVAPQNLGIGGGGNRPDPNQIFQRYDRNKDGKLSRDEIPDQVPPPLKQMFERLNKQEITREEFLQAFRAGTGGGGAAAFMRDPEAFFKQVDSNQDGKITAAEASEGLRPQIERWLTNRLGKGKDDSMTLDELKKIVAENTERDGGRPAAMSRKMLPGEMKSGETMPGETMPGDKMPAGAGRGGFAALLMRKLDADGDGKLSKDELQKVGDLFDELDRDHDGFIEPLELAGTPGKTGRPPAGAQSETGAATITPGEGKEPSEVKTESGVKPSRTEGAVSAGTSPDAASRKAGRPGGQKGPGGQKAQGPIRRLDTNGDGKISRSEAQGRLKENFDKIDANGDGFLEPDEIRKAVAANGTK